MYTAVCLSNVNYDQTGFESVDDARAYIAGFICEDCELDLQNGGCYHEGQWIEVKDVMQTECGYEWFIITDEDYEDVEDMYDIFIAAGLEPADEETYNSLSLEQKMRLEQKQEEDDISE